MVFKKKKNLRFALLVLKKVYFYIWCITSMLMTLKSIFLQVWESGFRNPVQNGSFPSLLWFLLKICELWTFSYVTEVGGDFNDSSEHFLFFE